MPRYRCVNTACEREVFAHNTSRLARPGWSTTRRCARYICHRLMIDRATVAVARELVCRGTPSTPSPWTPPSRSWPPTPLALTGTVIASTSPLVSCPPAGEDGYVTVIIDLTPVLEAPDVPASTWYPALSGSAEELAGRPDQRLGRSSCGNGRFGGYKTAAADVVPDATAVMDPFHVVALAGAKLDLCRQRIQQQTCGHRADCRSRPASGDNPRYD